MAADERPLYLDQADSYEFIRGLDRDTIFIAGAVFRMDSGNLRADTAVWIKGQDILLIGNVFVEDSLYKLSADRVIYDINTNSADASGDTVIIISEVDSVMARGKKAYYSRDSSIFRMWDRPSVFLNFQDTSKQTRVDGDRIALETKSKIGYADGQVVITRENTESHSSRAIAYLGDDVLLLLGEPVARRKGSEIKGDTLILYGQESYLRKIFVSGNAEGDFKEPSDKDSALYDISQLKASEIEFNLEQNALKDIIASGQSYSFYAPGSRDSAEIVKNNVSGDTIKLFIRDEKLQVVEVDGGAEGEYLTGKYVTNDTVKSFVEDTVKYSSDYIDYLLADSTITLDGHAAVHNKSVSLTAHKIKFNTAKELVTAFDDSAKADTVVTYFPVILKDGSEEIVGSYLEYSMNTEKGMIWQSKSEYQQAYYRGNELFREKKDVYYVGDGSYTSCDQDSAHYHFQSKKMKMIQGDKVIARPVVFYVERLPLMIIPYYVFPTKPGRHSGFLSFQIGNFERGDGYLHNVGYYWAASEYWDVLGAIDYTENFGLNYRSTLSYNVRYVMSGSITGSYAKESHYTSMQEQHAKRWRIAFSHAHTLSPTFNIRASGNFLSDKTYYTDYSTDLDDRLNRSIRSQLSLSKRWGSSSLTAQFIHDVYLDKESRTDQLPTASFSLPNRPLFGSPPKDENGKEKRKWYHSIYTRYGVNLNNYSSRKTDTTGVRSRKEYLTMVHETGLSAAFAVFKYLKLNPSLNYNETWYRIFETDQSETAGIDATAYRRYAYSASISASTDIYGTVSPNVFGIEGLRHVVTPNVGFSWAPDVTRHNDVKSYTGAGGGGRRQKAMSFSLEQQFQAKVKAGADSKKIDLFRVGSSVSYDFEAEERKFSDLSTSINTSLLRSFNLYLSASLTHDLYKPGTDTLHWWSPYLQSLSISTRFNIGGSLGEFETYGRSDSSQTGTGAGSKQKWSLSVSHSYDESGRGAAFTKRHQINLGLKFSLTPSIDVSYSQNYDIVRDKTINRRIEIAKNLHCWEGRFSWTIDGSNRGYYFLINVISIPDIKFEKSESGIRAPYF